MLAACACRLIIAAHFSSGKTWRLAATEFEAEPFHAAWWLPSPHGQTIAGRLLRQPSPPPFERIRLDTPDGDFLDLDIQPAPSRSEAPLVLLFHGLEGSARRGYAINTYRELFLRGVA